MKVSTFIAFFIVCSLTANAQKKESPNGFTIPSFHPSRNLEAEFIAPPDYAQPRVFWWWLEGNISKEGILHDLSEMKKAGIKGAILFDAGSSSYNNMKRTVAGKTFMSDEWRELFTYACEVADSLDLEISLNIGSGWNDGGPWVTPAQNAKKVVWSEIEVQGPRKIEQVLPLPNGLLKDEKDGSLYYEPIAVLALKLTSDHLTVSPLENLELKAVQSIRLPKAKDGSGYDWNFLIKEDSLASEKSSHAFLSDIIDITDKVTKEGKLVWNIPAGNYLIMRFGYTGTGIKVSTNSPGGGGLAIDYLSKEALDLQYDQTVGKLTGLLESKGIKSLTYLHDDSWELGAVNWSRNFESYFKQNRGYDPIPYLPVIAGKIIENREVSNRFLYDFRRTIADLVWENHYVHFKERAHKDGFGIHPESGGPHPAPIDALKNLGQNDIPMGEFWIRATTHRITPDARIFIKQSASAAHIYGKRFIQAEGPTSIGPHWEEDFAYMKPTLDRAYCEGLNRFVIHTFTHSPKDAGIPGNEYFAGTHFNPNVTWWKQAPAFLLWNTRVSFLLSQGLFVGDVCYYYGDNVPNQVHLKLPDKKLEAGYDYDVCNTEVLLNRMFVRNGRICLPDGMSYRVLVLPENRTALSIEALAKIEQLIREGATVIGRKPITSVGLKGGAKAIGEIKRLADTIWGTDNKIASKRAYGKGWIYTNDNIGEILLSNGTVPDFSYVSKKENALIDYIHRRTEDADIYYLANRNEQPEYFNASFRIEGKTPELWDPITGDRVNQTVYTSGDGCTRLPLFLEPFGSVFVIFRKPEAAHYTEIKKDGISLFPTLPADTFSQAPFHSLKDNRILFTEPGNYNLKTNENKNEKVSGISCTSIQLTTPWKVSFDPAWGGPESITFEKLISWTQHTDPGIRYYSGTAVYRNTFDFRGSPNKGKRIYLDLGTLYNLAEVSLNGRSLGVWWQPPFCRDITDFIREGLNELEIKVVNLWPNRIIGDQFLPEGKRFTRTNVGKFTKEYPLRPSGLLGPVEIRVYSHN